MISQHLLAWFGLAALAVLNGAARDMLYARSTGELAAHQISTVSLAVLIGIAAWFAERRWPLERLRDAAAVGAAWMLMTVAFEFLVGRAASGRSWDELFADYDLSAGRIWAFIPLSLAAAPVLAFLGRRALERDAG